jgi:sulfur relay (sulfurtransferase) complex TusBCD TusD component (DsrE family)
MGSLRTCNGVRLAAALARQEGNEVLVFLIGDAVSAAHRQQKVSGGYYNLEVMLGSIVSHTGVIGVCGTCMDVASRKKTSSPAYTGAISKCLLNGRQGPTRSRCFKETDMLFMQRAGENTASCYFSDCAGDSNLHRLVTEGARA